MRAPGLLVNAPCLQGSRDGTASASMDALRMDSTPDMGPLLARGEASLWRLYMANIAAARHSPANTPISGTPADTRKAITAH